MAYYILSITKGSYDQNVGIKYEFRLKHVKFGISFKIKFTNSEVELNIKMFEKIMVKTH